MKLVSLCPSAHCELWVLCRNRYIARIVSAPNTSWTKYSGS